MRTIRLKRNHDRRITGVLQAGSPIVEKMKNCIARIKAENPGISDADAKKMAMKKMMKGGKGYKPEESEDDMDD